MNPYLITEPTVISFSGGRTSAYMLWKCLEAHDGVLPDEAIVCFANTGKEAEATLKFVNDCAVNWNVNIVWLEYAKEKPNWKQVTYETASRNGEPFDALIQNKNYLPNTFARFCTSELKVIPMKKFIGNDDFVTFVGIRADEPRRVAKMKNNKDEKFCPLAVDGKTKIDIEKFWKSQSFDLELITVDGNALLGNCDLCFLKKLEHKINLIRQEPKRVIWWAEKEKQIGSVFRQDHPSYNEMAKFTTNQTELFDDVAIQCFCGD